MMNLPGPTGDGWDATPLQNAILARQPGSVGLLLEGKRNAAGKDAIWWARFQRCGEVLRLIGE